MLVNSAALLAQARANNTCVAAFNIYNLETLQAAFGAACKVKRPIMVALGESYLESVSLETIVAITKALCKDFPFDVVLHLDHCKNVDMIFAAIEAGFTSVMYDGSRLPLDENAAATRKVCDFAHARGVTVEGELGGLNEEDGSGEAPEKAQFTTVEAAVRYVQASQVDSLAVSVGNMHGLYKGEPNLDIERIKAIYAAVNIPLVLHGCSGIPEEQLREAIASGVAKINVNTEIALAGGDCLKAATAKEDTPIRMEKLMRMAKEDMQSVMERFLQL